MGFQEKRIYVSIITAIIIGGYFAHYLLDLIDVNDIQDGSVSQSIGEAVLYMIGASIVVHIIVQIIFSIVFSMLTKGRENDEFIPDERDRAIELKAMKISFNVFSAAFVCAMIFLAMGTAPNSVIVYVIFAMYFTSLLSDICKIAFYKKGF